jgi:cytochrome c peroxidase
MRQRGAALALALVGVLGCDDAADAARPTDAAATDATLADAAAGLTDAAVSPEPDAGREAAVPDLDAGLAALRPPPYPAAPYPSGNPASADKAMLGKILFWDEQLSSDDTVACGTCHQPAAGGADARAALSTARHPGADGALGTPDDPRGSPGIARCTGDSTTTLTRIDDAQFGSGPQVTRRRSMSFMDAMLSTSLFWDGRADSSFEDPLDPSQVLLQPGAALESQAVAPILNGAEMACDGRTWQDVVDKLEQATPLALAGALPTAMADAVLARPDYPALFQAAFGDAEITPGRIAFALASYERELRSDQTPLDRFGRGEEDAFSPAQLRGYRLFVGQAGCTCCHVLPELSRFDFIDDGFSAMPWDLGREEVTGNPADRGRFRVPPLRNVGLREAGGLLHDGLAPGGGLDSLVEAYNAPPVGSSNLCRRPLGLLAAERADLVEFLRHGLTDPRARDELPPFDRPRLASE